MPNFAIDFTDGDTFKRVSVTAPGVTAASKILHSMQVTNIADVDETGWTFYSNVVNVGTDTFDVDVIAVVLGEPGINDEGPSVIAELVYVVLQ